MSAEWYESPASNMEMMGSILETIHEWIESGVNSYQMIEGLDMSLEELEPVLHEWMKTPHPILWDADEDRRDVLIESVLAFGIIVGLSYARNNDHGRIGDPPKTP